MKKSPNLFVKILATVMKAFRVFTSKIGQFSNAVAKKMFKTQKEVSTNEITKPGQVFRINDEGMPHRDDPTNFGRLDVKMEVVMPKKLTEEQRDLVNKLFPGGNSRGREEL